MEEVSESTLVLQEKADQQMCRICAEVTEKYLGIFEQEGLCNDLPNKINLYLPIKVSASDALPVQCCWSCATTVINWHELVLGSIAADKHLKELHEVAASSVSSAEEENKCFAEVDYAEPEPSPDPDLDEVPMDDEEEVDNEGLDEDPEEIKPEGAATALLPDELPSTTPSPTSLNAFHPITTRTAKPRPRIIKQSQRIRKTRRITPTNKHTNEDANLWADTDYAQSSNSLKVEESDANVKARAVRKCNVIKFEINNKLVAHEADEDDEALVYEYLCQFCNALHASKAESLEHVRAEHGGVISKSGGRKKNTKIDQEAVNAAKVEVDGRVYYNCKICSKSLHSPYTYIWHRRIHTGERPFVCDLCGKQFRVSQGLVRHLKETHEGIKNFPCDLCGRMFATRRNVEEHRRIHTNERPYICDLCGKSFKQKASLFVHNRSHSDLFPHRCSYCNQGFRTRPPLLIHMTRHTGEKPFACEVCGRCFRIKYELKRHVLIHSDVKPFVCALCGLGFRQKRYLRNHNKINHSSSAMEAVADDGGEDVATDAFIN